MHGHQIVGTQKEVDLVLFDLIGLQVVNHAKEHQKVEAFVLVDLGALMFLRSVFHSQRVEVESIGHRLQFVERRRLEVEPQQIELVWQNQDDAGGLDLMLGAILFGADQRAYAVRRGERNHHGVPSTSVRGLSSDQGRSLTAPRLVRDLFSSG